MSLLADVFAETAFVPPNIQIEEQQHNKQTTLSILYYMVVLLERKDLTDYDKDIQNVIIYFDVKGNGLKLKGSSTLEHLNYRSDIDILVIVNNKITIHEQFNKLKKGSRKYTY